MLISIPKILTQEAIKIIALTPIYTMLIQN